MNTKDDNFESHSQEEVNDDDNILSDDGLNDHDNYDDDDNNSNDNDNEDDEDDLFEQLLPPKPDYKYADDEDLDELMGIELNNMNRPPPKSSDKNSNKNNTQSERQCCVRKYGNTIILNTKCFNKTRKYGLIGPHYPGPMFTFALLYGASYYFTKKAFDTVGSVSGFTCIGFTFLTTIHLLKIICVDPGVVKFEEQLVQRKKNERSRSNNDDNNEDSNNSNGEICAIATKDSEYETIMKGEEEGWRYCGACSVYQPPNAAHCPDCNVCVEGYDHHCPWMGTCIGKKNMNAFMCFNFTWLIYLLYCCLWVVALGPVLSVHGISTSSNSTISDDMNDGNI